MLRQYPISYSYSASLLDNQRQNKHAGKMSVAYVPEYTGLIYNDSTLNKNADDLNPGLMPLVGAEDEVDHFSGYYNCKVYNGRKATENIFKKTATQHNIIHLAMHTIIDDKNPMYSKMIFSQDQDKIEDGFLHTFELYGMTLKANLITLSSCNTGYGKMQKGEGLLSLARGFIYAGCSGIILTQWAVADKASAKLIRSFYYYLSEGNTKDKALQYSKIDYLKNADPVKTHPYFWAGYIVFGDTSPLAAKKTYTIYIIMLIAVSLITAGYFIRKRRC